MSDLSKGHELLGRGGGMGRYQGLSVEEFSDRLQVCVAQPSMRSVNAVLRITREQLDARGSMNTYPFLAALFGVLALLSLALAPVMPKVVQEQAGVYQSGLGAVFAILLFGVFSSRDARRANVAQEKAIKRICAESLSKLLENDFALKPLQREYVQTLRDVLKQEKSATNLYVLLSVGAE